MANKPDLKVSESVLGSPGPAMKQAMEEFRGLALDAPASLGESLPNAYALQKQRDAEASSGRSLPNTSAFRKQRGTEAELGSYAVRGNGYYARSAAEDFYTEEFLGDVDLGYQG